MTEIVNLSISQNAASELSRQASFAGSPGEMYIDLIKDDIGLEGWIHIKLKPGKYNGSPILEILNFEFMRFSNKTEQEFLSIIIFLTFNLFKKFSI